MISLFVAKRVSKLSTTSFVKVAIPHSRGGNDPTKSIRGGLVFTVRHLPGVADLSTSMGGLKNPAREVGYPAVVSVVSLLGLYPARKVGKRDVSAFPRGPHARCVRLLRYVRR